MEVEMQAGVSEQKLNWINKRAYFLWEEAGRPEGKSQEHWIQACAERGLMELTMASPDGIEVLKRLRGLAQ
jgi:hypothetical protein